MQVTYDPKEVSFTTLLEAFADKTDLTQMNRQGSDRGTQYRSGVYYHTDEQKADTEAFYKRLEEEIAAGKRNWSGKSVVSELKPAGDYFIAEKYHQQYLAKGGRFGIPQSAEKGNTDTIRCYG
jgi:peptide-methionine (S)-S-oxide reductase